MTQVVSRNFGNQSRSKGKDFLSYFKNTYYSLECQFPIEMWNHFDNHDDRTNNRVEGDNNKMKLFCGHADPKIDKAVNLLQVHERTARDKYENGKKENARAPAQKPEDIIKEERFRQSRRFLRDGKITHAVYKQEVLEMHQFVPKKKYIEELDDTDESDPPSDSEDSSDNDEADEENDVDPSQTEDIEPPQTEAIEPPQIIRTTPPTDEQSRTVDSCLINLRYAACCVQPRDYGCPPNDIDEDFLNEIEDRGPNLINLQPRRGLVNQQTQNQFTQIQSQEESETTHLINQMNNSSLLENTDIENERAEIPPETIIPHKANTGKCIHCGKSYTIRGMTKHSNACDKNPNKR